jgi:hypothetical protein
MDRNDAGLWRQNGRNSFRSSHTRRLGCCPALIRESPGLSVSIPSGERSLLASFCYRADRAQGIGEVVAVINEQVGGRSTLVQSIRWKEVVEGYIPLRVHRHLAPVRTVHIHSAGVTAGKCTEYALPTSHRLNKATADWFPS